MSSDSVLQRYIPLNAPPRHDWPDHECVEILSRVRDAMSVDSRLLIADIIVHSPTPRLDAPCVRSSTPSG